MKKSKKKSLGRKLEIGDKIYFYIKKEKHQYVTLNGDVVYTNKGKNKSTKSVSRWIKEQKNK